MLQHSHARPFYIKKPICFAILSAMEKLNWFVSCSIFCELKNLNYLLRHLWLKKRLSLLLFELRTFLSEDVIWKRTLLDSFSFFLDSISLVPIVGSLRTFRWITDSWTKPRDSRIRTIFEFSVKLKRRKKPQNNLI